MLFRDSAIASYSPELASKLPGEIKFGTSSWTYRGWNDVVYFDSYKNDKSFRSDSLREYVQFPWFRTVGVDSFFYKPPTLELLKQYSSMVDEDFEWCTKVWEEISIPFFGKHPRYGLRANTKNSNFLDSSLFNDRVLAPFSDASVMRHAGPFIFQFQKFPKSEIKNPSWFFESLDRFFAALPNSFRYAVEVRNPELLSKEYFSLLNAHKATHCFNHWTSMPSLSDQMRAAASAGGLEASFFLSRILTPLSVSYKDAVKRFQPYDKLQESLPEMRKDVITLARRAFKTKKSAYVIVNNRAEGHAPKTISDIASEIVQHVAEWQDGSL